MGEAIGRVLRDAAASHKPKPGRVLPGTRVAVDHWARREPGSAFPLRKVVSREGSWLGAGLLYFLSHAHADHMSGLSASFDRPIHCSPLTAQLLHLFFGIPPSLLRWETTSEP